jgi:hypothetical protein
VHRLEEKVAEREAELASLTEQLRARDQDLEAERRYGEGLLRKREAIFH